MAIYITGDTHGTYDVNKFMKIKDMLTEDDYIIVLGDFGICWDNSGHDNIVRNFWSSFECTVLFVDGNHENHTLLNSYPISEWNGGKVHAIGDKIKHLMRGQIFEIEGKTFFTMGGAASHDCGEKLEQYIMENLDDYHQADWNTIYATWRSKYYYGCRTPGRSWWAEEIPSPTEIAEAKENLAKAGNKADYVLTHAASRRVFNHLGFTNERSWDGILLDFFDYIEENIQFDNWWFGHLHTDFIYDERHIGFYDTIREAK